MVRARVLRERAGTLTGHAVGETQLAVDAARANVLDDVASVYQAGEDRLWSEVIVARLAEQRPDAYQGWTPNALAAALKPHGIAPKQIPLRDDTGAERNKRGYLLAAITEVILATRRVSTESDDSPV